jgi:hypothetical protein
MSSYKNSTNSAIVGQRESTGNITDKMVDEYLKHHRKDKDSNNKMILE